MDLEGLPLGSALLGVAILFRQPVELYVPVMALASALPRRGRFARRALLLGIPYAVLWLAGNVVHYHSIAHLAGAADGSAFSLTSSLALLASTVPMLLLLFDVTPWGALLCASAGYTIQNIASAVSETAFVVLGAAGVVTPEVFPAPEVAQDALWLRLLVSTLSDVAIFALCYRTFIRKIRRRGLNDVTDRRMTAMLGLVILAVISFDVVIKQLTVDGATTAELLILRAVHLAVAAFVLFVEYEMLYSRALETEMALDRQMAAERERQYRLSRENVDAINLKLHDIRHQIRQVADGGLAGREALDDIAHEIDVYDAQYHTGNDALDTILTEKGLVCEREAIELTCIADGSALSGLSPAEIYSLFGNALDNALQATRAVDDPERRSVSLVVRRTGGLATIHLENYFTGARSFSADGLPRTTQRAEEGHGYGTRSMRQIVERHGGTLALGTRGDIFTLARFARRRPAARGPAPKT